MKTRTILIVGALLALAAVSFGQINVTSGTVAGIGTSYTEHTSDLMAVSHGNSGANQTWTIPTETWATSNSLSLIDPSTTPFSANFPGATLAASSDTGSAWSYFRVASDGYYFMGLASQVDTFTILEVFNPQFELSPLPISYPHAAWTSVAHYSFLGFNFVDSTISTLDAWGTVNTPYGSFQALRVFNRVWNIGFTTSASVNYSWINAQGIVIAEVMSPGGVTDPNFTQGMYMATEMGTSAVEPTRGPVAQSFQVQQNYPNPFNPTTVVPFDLSRNATVKMDIYNEMGRLVSSEQFNMPAGQHAIPVNGSQWASGTYFAKLSAEGKAQTVKMELLK